MLAIVVVGLARSGKDTFANYLVEKYSFKKFDFFNDVIVPLMKKQGLEITKANASTFGNEMRAKFGMGVFGEKMAELIKNHDKVVITGARSMEELTPIERQASRFYIVRIEAPKETRFARRTELDADTQQEFFARDENDIKNKGLGEVLKAANIVIVNNSTLAEFYKAIDELMEKI
ncbi:MAG: hypothetical protein J7L44_02015 [Candidatus Diapherotrites archaeon]|nr:hypothetical protein [Candidatus Diapherotrites archaeon]